MGRSIWLAATLYYLYHLPIDKVGNERYDKR